MKNKSQAHVVLNTIQKGDAHTVLKTIASDSIDSVVTDPPYGISFLNKSWDTDVPAMQLWKELLRVLKPGGHLIAFSASRTYHRTATNIEAAGFQIRDQLMWIYASGFPRSHNIYSSIAKKYGSKAAQEWRGWGNTLKPAHEPIVLARKPLVGTVAENVLSFGTGGLNIDTCRLQHKDTKRCDPRIRNGRFPANVMTHNVSTHWAPYFYCSKPTTKERDCGLDPIIKEQHVKEKSGFKGITGTSKNHHPTVKPIKLMEYLITLVTPCDGVVLDPFAGSGSTLIAAKNLGHPYIGIEQDEGYVEIAKLRIAA